MRIVSCLIVMAFFMIGCDSKLAWSPDSNSVYFVYNPEAHINGVARYQLDSKTIDVIIPAAGHTQESIDNNEYFNNQVWLTPDGSKLIVNTNATNSVEIFDAYTYRKFTEVFCPMSDRGFQTAVMLNDRIIYFHNAFEDIQPGLWSIRFDQGLAREKAVKLLDDIYGSAMTALPNQGIVYASKIQNEKDAKNKSFTLSLYDPQTNMNKVIIPRLDPEQFDRTSLLPIGLSAASDLILMTLYAFDDKGDTTMYEHKNHWLALVDLNGKLLFKAMLPRELESVSSAKLSNDGKTAFVPGRTKQKYDIKKLTLEDPEHPENGKQNYGPEFGDIAVYEFDIETKKIKTHILLKKKPIHIDDMMNIDLSISPNGKTLAITKTPSPHFNIPPLFLIDLSTQERTVTPVFVPEIQKFKKGVFTVVE